mmetsp:Transcript_10612/g.28821  ORF Transcript_10612/g.28821 Transcript_10612/m.28821 type:complete len:229 (-) Transcript_10612:75-761(-)
MLHDPVEVGRTGDHILAGLHLQPVCLRHVLSTAVRVQTEAAGGHACRPLRADRGRAPRADVGPGLRHLVGRRALRDPPPRRVRVLPQRRVERGPAAPVHPHGLVPLPGRGPAGLALPAAPFHLDGRGQLRRLHLPLERPHDPQEVRRAPPADALVRGRALLPRHPARDDALRGGHAVLRRQADPGMGLEAPEVGGRSSRRPCEGRLRELSRVSGACVAACSMVLVSPR